MSTPQPKLAMRTVTRPVAILLALTLTLIAALLIGSQSTSTASDTAGAAARGTVGKTADGSLTSKITGTTSDGRKVTGNFTPLKFLKKDGTAQVKGVIDGVITAADGSREKFTALRALEFKKLNGQLVNGRSAMSAAATCPILHLVLGPLDLDLLGLQVHLNQVVLDIVAVSGAGNLLGNLLCSVAGLLDGGPLGGLLGQLNSLLNQILAALNLGI